MYCETSITGEGRNRASNYSADLHDDYYDYTCTAYIYIINCRQCVCVCVCIQTHTLTYAATIYYNTRGPRNVN